MFAGVAENDSTEAGGGSTVSVEVSVTLPPGPVQVSVYEYVPTDEITPVDTFVATVGLDPLHEPDAVHVSTPVLVHDNAAAVPAVIVEGLRLTSTAALLPCDPLETTTLAVEPMLPPAPVQVSVYE